MLDQIYKIQKWSQERVHNVVVMGTGEPLDNYDSLLRFIHLLTDEGGLHISQRNLTVSTCGIVPNMRRLADEKLQITLALSLHASSQEKRKTLMPVAYKFDLKDVLDACRYYFEQTGRRTFRICDHGCDQTGSTALHSRNRRLFFNQGLYYHIRLFLFHMYLLKIQDYHLQESHGFVLHVWNIL